MNNAYYNKDIFPQAQYNENTEPIQSYIKNIQPYLNDILKNNCNKKAKIYMNFPYDEKQKEFNGIIEQIGNDYIILSEPATGNWKLLPSIYLNYIIFEEKINYER